MDLRLALGTLHVPDEPLEWQVTLLDRLDRQLFGRAVRLLLRV